MNKPESPKPNIFSKIGTNLSWISALFFPKKSKPPAKPVAATPPAPRGTAEAPAGGRSDRTASLGPARR